MQNSSYLFWFWFHLGWFRFWSFFSLGGFQRNSVALRRRCSFLRSGSGGAGSGPGAPWRGFLRCFLLQVLPGSGSPTGGPSRRPFFWSSSGSRPRLGGLLRGLWVWTGSGGFLLWSFCFLLGSGGDLGMFRLSGPGLPPAAVLFVRNGPPVDR